MEKLLIILLIFNLSVSCGKKKQVSGTPRSLEKEVELEEPTSSEEEGMEEDSEKEKPLVIKNEVLLDSDGDSIADGEDARPFISDIPTLKELIRVKINGVAYPLFHHFESRAAIIGSLRKDILKQNKKVSYMRTSYYVNIPIGVEVLNVDIENLVEDESFEINILDKKKIIFKGMKISSEGLHKTLRSKDLIDGRISFSLNKFFVLKNKEYVDILEESKRKTYQLNLRFNNINQSHRVSNSIKVDTALEILNLRHVLGEFNFTQKVLSTTSIFNMGNALKLLSVFNLGSQSLSQTPEAGKDIYLFHYSKFALARYKKMRPSGISLNSKKRLFSRTFKNAMGIKISVGASLKTYSQIEEGSLASSSGPELLCITKKFSIKTLENNKIRNFLIFKVNGNIYSYDELKKLIFLNTKESVHLEIYSNSYSTKNFFKGVKKIDPSCPTSSTLRMITKKLDAHIHGVLKVDILGI